MLFAELLGCLKDALIDSLKLLPFLFAAYLFIEYLEHRASDKMTAALSKYGRWNPVIGAAAGLVPQCGFSVSAADLFAGRIISFGTLAAVFMSTSDEALPILLASDTGRAWALPLLGIKFVVAACAGLLIDTLHKRPSEEEHFEAHDEMHAHCDRECCEHGILRTALHHTLTSFLFIFGSVIVINIALLLIGEETLAALLAGKALLGPVVASLIGFIPGCGASILLTQLFTDGAISFGALCAGLTVNSGIGLLVLLRSNKHARENLSLCGILLLTGLLTGFVVNLLT
ncbi:MAG: putative manganese transporter [Oscillospiraceae bacterium]|nr:putative manganese transporter [Oscillospiraceae bacterium]